MDAMIQELSKLSPATLATLGTVLAALAAATGAIAAAVVTGILGKIIVSPFLSARDRQDREAEWRKHALELTKLDLERKLRTRGAGDTSRIRPSILDFLANYRDLQELGTKTPKDLYIDILDRRITSTPAPALPEPPACIRAHGLHARMLGGVALALLAVAALGHAAHRNGD
jgi:hypothetical protein